MTQIVHEVTLVMTNVAGNNNKLWIGRAYENGSVDTEWGRVGAGRQTKTYHKGSQDSAIRFVNSKAREKERKGYQQIEVADSAGSSADKSQNNVALKKAVEDQIKTSSEEVRELLRELVKRNIHNILAIANMDYDTDTGMFSTPIGIVTGKVIAQAQDLLGQIGDILKAGTEKTNSDFIELVENYLMRIPQRVSVRLDPFIIFPDLDAVKRQNSLLEDLQASLANLEEQVEEKTQDVEIADLFNASMEECTDPTVLKEINDLYNDTKQSVHECHHLKVKRVFSVNIASMDNAFENKGKNVGNIKRLWHGTRAGNIISMLKSGMIIPPTSSSHVTGRMFGNGIYASDQSTKALNYAYGYWDGGRRDKTCFMFLCEVAMGKEYKPDRGGAWSNTYPKKGYDSTFAVGSRDNKSNNSGVYNNEMIVYDVAQIRPLYLIEFG